MSSRYKYLVGKKIHIDYMVGEPHYNDKEGIVQLVDDCDQIHGTWGGLALQPERDEFHIIND